MEDKDNNMKSMQKNEKTFKDRGSEFAVVQLNFFTQ